MTTGKKFKSIRRGLQAGKEYPYSQFASLASQQFYFPPNLSKKKLLAWQSFPHSTRRTYRSYKF